MTDFERELLENYREETHRFIEAVERQGKRNCCEKIALCVTIVLVTFGFLFYLYQYDFSATEETTTTTTTLEQSTDGCGDANYIGQDGDINYGKAESDDNNNEKNNDAFKDK